MTSVHLDNVTISYDRHPAVHHVSGTFASGSLTAIAGPNGAGKSTLLKAIAEILVPGEGRIAIAPDSSPIRGEVRRGAQQETPEQVSPHPNPPPDGEGDLRLAYMPQASEMQRDFPLMALHMVASGAWHQAGGFGAITNTMKEQASQALIAVGLRGFEKRDLSGLSAGQFQRALFARLLMQDAPLILLDEPFTAIDANTTAQLLDIVLRWHKEGRTVIAVLHDFEQIRHYFPQCLLMARECIAWGDSATVLQKENLLNMRFFHDDWKAMPATCEHAV